MQTGVFPAPVGKRGRREVFGQNAKAARISVIVNDWSF